MGTQVTNGADTARLRQVAEGLSVSARRVLEVEQEGATSIGTLVESWAGPDTQVFAADWQSAGPQLVAAAELLSALARQLVEQAEQQDDGSDGSGRGGGPLPSTPGRRAGDPMEDLAGLVPRLFDVKNGDGRYWPDMTAAAGPRFGPQDPALRYLFDRGTDWANDLYVDHRGTPWVGGAPLIERGLMESSDWLRDVKDEYLKKKTNPLPFDGPSILLDVVADTLEDYGKILHDPKGWWDNDATTWDKVSLGISLVPYLGVLGKVAVKTTKEAFDVVAKGFKHADDVKHVPAPRVWADDLDGLDDATKLKGSNDPLERGYGENAETAKKLIANNDIHSPDDVWDAGNGPRGLIIESIHGGNLPAGFKVIDRIETVDGVDRAVSTKTLDATLPSYDGKPKVIEYQVNRYVRALDNFEGSSRPLPDGTPVRVRATDYDQKVLELFVRTDSMGDDDWAAVERARASAKKKGIDVEVKEWP